MSKKTASRWGVLLALVAAIVAFTACQPRQVAATMVDPDVPIKAKFKLVEGPSYSADIQPIFNNYCVSCHGPEKAENGLRLDSYDHVMAGTRYGEVVIPEWPEASTLVYVLRRSTAREIAMPHDNRKLTPNRIKNIMYWIEAGALNN